MGSIQVVNDSGYNITDIKLQINNNLIIGKEEGSPDQDTSLANNTRTKQIPYGYSTSKQFHDMNFDFTVSELENATYHLNLSRNHWFGGAGEEHYPGSGSDVRFTIVNESTSGGQDFHLLLEYKAVGQSDYIQSDDNSKKFDLT